MPIHVDTLELAARRGRAAEAMVARGLDGLLLFRQESLYYLTGFDSFGYVFFQCLHLGADGGMALLTRAPDLRQARFTSVIEDARAWADGPDADPVAALRGLLEERGARGSRLGVEWDAYGLTARIGFALADGLAGFCALEDASDLVSRLRLVKSPAELAFVRRAAALVDEAVEVARGMARPGVFEGDILAAMHGTMFRNGGDEPANETIIGSGPGALMCRSFSGRRELEASDQLTLEVAGVFRHYHACLMRTLRIGAVPARQRVLHDAAVAALEAAKAALSPGVPLGRVFEAHAAVLDRAGLRAHRMNAGGYALGATFAPSWMDWPMLFAGNPEPAAVDMIFFLHVIVFDSDAGLAASTGQTVRVTEALPEVLTRAPLDLVPT